MSFWCRRLSFHPRHPSFGVLEHRCQCRPTRPPGHLIASTQNMMRTAPDTSSLLSGPRLTFYSSPYAYRSLFPPCQLCLSQHSWKNRCSCTCSTSRIQQISVCFRFSQKLCCMVRFYKIKTRGRLNSSRSDIHGAHLHV
jgi:hypothetical protein